MAKPSAKHWLDQAISDLACAKRCLKQDDATTYCHAIAKYQQATEKAIKGLVVALKLMEPTRDHEVTDELKRLSVISSNPGSKANKTFVENVNDLLDPPNRSQIRALAQLSPKYPEADGLARRNTEYPFQNAVGEWEIPADSDAFHWDEVKQFRRVANFLVLKADQIRKAREIKSAT